MDQQDPTVDSGRAGHMIDTIQNQLMLGQISPAQAQIELQHILNLPLQPNRWLPSIHAQLLYLLGLTHELNGKNSQAAQTYLELWQTFPDNPYAVMAYAKLEPAK
jgi:hypothetical protein